jgi:hypothetical protein
MPLKLFVSLIVILLWRFSSSALNSCFTCWIFSD